MTGRPVRPLVALTAHAREVAAADRARLAETLDHDPPDGVALVTCHRVEAYGWAGDGALDAAAAVAPPGVHRLQGPSAVRHLVGVAVGRDSAVLGEDEILHQLRAAAEAARSARRLDPALDRLVADALRAGRTARSWQQRRRRSLGDVAVAAIRKRVVPGDQPLRLLVVGAGTIGALAARSAATSGALVWVANRTHARAQALATSCAGEVASLDPGALTGGVDGVVVAIGAPWRIGPAATAGLRDGGAVVVDVAFPPAAAELAPLLGPRYLSADDLAQDASRDASPALAARLDALVEATVADIEAWTERDGSRAAAAALVQRADEERTRQLDRLWRRIPAVDDDTRAAIEDMTRHLADRLLGPPLERLGRDRDDRATAAVRDLFAL